MAMQPPVNLGHLRGYIEQLKIEARSIATTPQGNPNKSIDRINEHSQKISEWVNELPDAQKSQPYSIDAIIRLAGLTGLYAQHPSHQRIAIALRKSGFIQLRSWKKSNRNRRLWIWHPKITKDSQYCS